MNELRIFRCPRHLARQAVEAWHYSRSLPAAGLDLYGVKERGRFIGVVVFGMGANPNLARPFGLRQDEVRELARVALCDDRSTPTSKIVANCLRRLQRDRPEVRLCVSYADTSQGHLGTLYQAGNWCYLGPSKGRFLRVNGERLHTRSAYQRWRSSSVKWLRAHIDPNATAEAEIPKHKYAYPFDSQVRRRLRRLACPYPRAVKESEATRPSATREGHVRSVLTAPKDSSVSCDRHRNSTGIAGRTRSDESEPLTKETQRCRKRTSPSS